MQREFGVARNTPVPPPFYRPFPTRTTDVFAAGAERETRLYFETRMEIPQLPPLPNAVPRTQLDIREARKDFAERQLIHPTSSALCNLREDLRPNALPRQIDMEPQRRHAFPSVIDVNMGQSRPSAFETPIACRLSDAVRRHAIEQSAPPRYGDDRSWMTQRDLLDPAFCGIARETQTIRSQPNLWMDGQKMVNLDTVTREGMHVEMPRTLGTISLMDPAISRRQHAEFIAYQQRRPDLPNLEAVSVSEGPWVWTPEKTSTRTACPSTNPQFYPFSQLDPCKMGAGNDAHNNDDLPSLHSMRAAILNPSLAAAPSVLQKILKNAPEAEISAPRSCFSNDTKSTASFARVMSEYGDQKVDIQRLPPAAWPSDNPAVPEGVPMPRMNDASHPVAHLDLYLPWNLHKQDPCRPHTVPPSFVPEMEARRPIPESKNSRGWTDLLYNTDPPAESLIYKPLSRHLTEAAPVHPRNTSPVTRSQNDVEVQEPVASDVQYLLKLREKYQQGGMVDAAVGGLPVQSASRPTVQPPSSSECRPWRRLQHLTVEMTPTIEELLNKMQQGHATLMAALSPEMHRELGADLFDLCSYRDCVPGDRKETASGAACMEIRVLRETSWCLLHLGILSAYHHLEKVCFLMRSSVFTHKR